MSSGEGFICFVSLGYRCHHDGCQVLEHTWGKLLKHMAKHPGKKNLPCLKNIAGTRAGLDCVVISKH